VVIESGSKRARKGKINKNLSPDESLRFRRKRLLPSQPEHLLPPQSKRLKSSYYPEILPPQSKRLKSSDNPEILPQSKRLKASEAKAQADVRKDQKYEKRLKALEDKLKAKDAELAAKNAALKDTEKALKSSVAGVEKTSRGRNFSAPEESFEYSGTNKVLIDVANLTKKLDEVLPSMLAMESEVKRTLEGEIMSNKRSLELQEQLLAVTVRQQRDEEALQNMREQRDREDLLAKEAKAEKKEDVEDRNRERDRWFSLMETALKRPI